MTTQPEGTSISSLSGRLGARRAATPTAPKPKPTKPAPKSTDSTEQTTTPTPPAPAPAPAKKAAPARRASQSADTKGTLAVQLDEDIHAAADRRRVADGTTWAALIFDAIEANKDTIPAEIARELAARAEAKKKRAPGQLFARPTRQSATKRVYLAPLVLTADRELIDTLAREAGAPTRREYIQTALRLHCAA